VLVLFQRFQRQYFSSYNTSNIIIHNTKTAAFKYLLQISLLSNHLYIYIYLEPHKYILKKLTIYRLLVLKKKKDFHSSKIIYYFYTVIGLTPRCVLIDRPPTLTLILKTLIL